MPRSMLNTECVFVNPLCHAPSPPARPVTQIAAGAYLELHGVVDWRMYVTPNGRLATQKKVDGMWLTRGRVE